MILDVTPEEAKDICASLEADAYEYSAVRQTEVAQRLFALKTKIFKQMGGQKEENEGLAG